MAKWTSGLGVEEGNAGEKRLGSKVKDDTVAGESGAS